MRNYVKEAQKLIETQIGKVVRKPDYWLTGTGPHLEFAAAHS